MQTVLIVIHLMLVLGLIGVVLLQRSEGGGLGMGGTSSSGFLSSRGTANVLTRATALLAAGFFVTSLTLSIIAGYGRKPATILGTDAPATQQQAPGAAPPISGGDGNLLDQLRGPPQPGGSGPQVPPSK
jgi:preprotein translocase subunit SecG